MMLSTVRQMRFWHIASPKNQDKAREELLSIMLKKENFQHFLVNHKNPIYSVWIRWGFSLLEMQVWFCLKHL